MTVLVLASGGLDSAVVWTKLLREGTSVVPVFVDYGQSAAAAERAAVTAISDALSCPLRIATVRDTWLSYPLDAPLPARNLVLISIAAALAGEMKLHAIAIGFVREEVDFPDASGSFLRQTESALSEGGLSLALTAPLSSMSKSDVLELGLQINAPVALTYSCYLGKASGCGHCGGCWRREAAFRLRSANDS